MTVFYNYSLGDFECNWGGVPYVFKSGEVYSGVVISKDGQSSITLNEVVARIFASHLAKKVLNTPSLNANYIKDGDGRTVPNIEAALKYNTSSIELLVERALQAPGVSVQMPSFVDELPVLKEEAVEAPLPQPVEVPEEPVVAKKKPGRPKKVKEESSPSPEAEFDV